jgi:hypothetical protein
MLVGARGNRSDVFSGDITRFELDAPVGHRVIALTLEIPLV